LFTSGETLSVRTSSRMIITKNIEAQVTEEINKAVASHIESIDETCSDDIFIYKVTKSDTIWTVRCCTVCGRPNLVHPDPWIGQCTQDAIDQDLKAEYIDQAENHRRIKQVARLMIPQEDEDEIITPGEPRPRSRLNRGEYKEKSKCKFPLWKENTTWSEYEPMIVWHRRTSKKEPEDQFMDLVNALNESNKDEIAKRLMQNFRNHANLKKIMDDAVGWLDANYGASKTDRIKKSAESIQTIRRREDEDMAEFIIRFEAMMDQMRSVNLDLSEQVETAILQRSANLTKSEENDLLPMVDMTSEAAGLTLKMKEALRNVGFRQDKKTGSATKKEEVVLLQYECQEDPDGVHYGGRFRYNNNRGQQQQQGGYQKPMGFQGNFQQNQGNFQNFNQGNFQRQQNQGQRNFNFQKNPNKPVGAGIVNAINELSQKEQMEIVGTIAKTFMKPPIIIPNS